MTKNWSIFPIPALLLVACMQNSVASDLRNLAVHTWKIDSIFVCLFLKRLKLVENKCERLRQVPDFY